MQSEHLLYIKFFFILNKNYLQEKKFFLHLKNEIFPQRFNVITKYYKLFVIKNPFHSYTTVFSQCNDV